MNIVNETIKNLEKNNFKVKYFETVEEANQTLLKEILINEDIGIGGSVTITQMGIFELLKERGNNVYWHHRVKPEKRDETLKKAREADTYISSTNAVTKDGKLVNIDGVGNRVSEIVFGHKKVIVIIGVNKLTQNYDKAIERIKTVVCPKNAERLNLEVPCRYTGKCIDCDSEQRMCRATVILDKQPMRGNIHVYIINKELGY